jgi:hypothetical protein
MWKRDTNFDPVHDDPDYPRKEPTMIDELQETVETLIELDEPEAILPTLRRAAERQKGVRWRQLAAVLGEAETKLDQLVNAKPAGPDFTAPKDDAGPEAA